MSMYCYQCEQTAKGTGCTNVGVCGKSPEAAALQDLLVHALKGIARFASRARKHGAIDREIDLFAVEALFSTVTNVDFDPDRLEAMVRKAGQMLDRSRRLHGRAAGGGDAKADLRSGPSAWEPAADREGLLAQAREVGIESRQAAMGPDRAGLVDLVTYGLKGMSAYAHHAHILGEDDDETYGFIHEALDALSEPDPKTDELLALALRCGEVNLRVMETLDRAHTRTFGDPEPTRVRVEPIQGKAILVSGHDLKDLEELLKQTEGTGINVYTHGEMLPAHGYPGLRRFGHLVGNYGGAWQDQREEFEAFPGSILMTTNCIQRPRESYVARIFTTGLVAWPGVRHVVGRDFAPVIKAALEAPGFDKDGEDRRITVGFGHKAVLAAAGKVVDLVKRGAIRRFFLIGGCDGAKSGRSYYTELAESLPRDTVILTLACGKYRFNKLDFGDIEGLPRLLDIGQCNDAYSAIRIASALAEAFGTDVNGLPLSLVLSWYEQKAVAILLTLLHLGIKGMRIGPSLPAFLTPAAVSVLVETFGLTPIGTPAEDLRAMLG